MKARTQIVSREKVSMGYKKELTIDIAEVETGPLASPREDQSMLPGQDQLLLTCYHKIYVTGSD